jgi:hypothetical protein
MKKSILILLALAFALSACSAAQAVEDSYRGADTAYSMEMPAAAPEAAAMEEAEAGYADEMNAPSGQAAAVERMVIKNASLGIIVPDPASALNTVGRMAESMGGYVVNSNIYKTRAPNGAEVPEAYTTIRVPSERLNDALDQIKALVKDPGTDVLNENISGEDVTQSYVDLKSRLRNQEDAAAQLREILAEARRTEDVLAVYRELNSVSEQIEVLKGQIQYYEESARLSAITVTIQSEEAIAPITIAGWTPVGVARDAVQTLVDALQTIANGAIWGVLFCLPIGLIILIPLYFLWRGFLRLRARRQTAKEAVVVSPAPPAE